MRVTLLGCGSSTGVPAIGPDGWGNCDPENPKNRRTRPSLLVEEGDTTILIDTPPDLRDQLLRERKYKIDAVLYTHAHADHVHGIDDLRSVNFHMGAEIDAYADPETAALLQTRFAYIFDGGKIANAGRRSGPRGAGWAPRLRLHEIDGPWAIGPLSVVPFEQDHGPAGTSLGFKIGPMAYSTDVKALSEEAFGILEGVELWFVDCLGERPHPTHTHLAQTLEWIERVAPKRAILTHMSVRMDYAAVDAATPDHVEPGFDGLTVDL